MEYSESKGILEKMITNETLAKMTRTPHFNPKSGLANGFRSPTLPSHLNGKTMPSLSSLAHSGSKSNPDQPRRSIIKLPGPPVNNTPGASTTSSGGLKSSKSCSLDKFPSEKSLRGRSRKRSREDDPLLDSSNPHQNRHHLHHHPDERKDGCEHSTSASETVEPTKRKRRGQSSKRSEKRGDQVPVETSLSKLRVSSSTAVPGILDVYGIKSRPVDVSRYMVDLPLDKLLSENLERGQGNSAMESDSRGEDSSRVVVEEISNVMRILPRHSFSAAAAAAHQKASSFVVENASHQSEDVKVRLMLDLERPLQAEESQSQQQGGGDVRQEIAAASGSLDKARSKSLELFPTFRLEDLPLYTVGDFLDKLKLPVNDSLETLISYSKPTDPAGSASDKNPRYEGIPPFPFSFSPCGVRVDPPRNGKTQWSKDNPLAKSRSDPTPVKVEALEHLDGKNDSRSSARLLKEESRDQEERGKEKSKASENLKKGFPAHSELPSLQIKRDDGEARTPHSCRSLSFPAMPCSPGAQAATILLNMANSDEKEFPPKEKQGKDEGPVQKTLKLARVVEERDSRSGHLAGTTAATTTAAAVAKKSPVSEKKRSLSQVNHSLAASVSKRLASGSAPDSAPARSSSSGHGLNSKPEDYRHHQQQQQPHNNNNSSSNNHHHHHHQHHPREAGKLSSGAGGNKAKEKESHREGKSLNGVLGLGASSKNNNPSSAKAAVASRRESSSLSRSQHSLAKSKTKLR